MRTSTITKEEGKLDLPSPTLCAPSSSIIKAIVSEIPANYSNSSKYLISFSAPEEIQWNKVNLHKSYNKDSCYCFKEEAIKSGITGIIKEVGYIDDKAYIKIVLDTKFDLESALDFNSLMTSPDLNLCGFKTLNGQNIFIRYEDVELIDKNTWILSGLIYDTGGFSQLNSYGSLITGDTFYLLSEVPYIRDLKVTEIGKTLYFKLTSVNFRNEEQALGDIENISLDVKGLAFKPLPPCNIKINNIGISSSNILCIAKGDINISWMSRNRHFIGMTDFNRTDTSREDIEFENFVLEIYNENILLRTAIQTAKLFVYTEAMQNSDGEYTTFNIKLQQKNLSFISDYSDTITINII